jgi:hypothetical protein
MKNRPFSIDADAVHRDFGHGKRIDAFLGRIEIP